MLGNKNKKAILLGTLLILILGVSIGFAAYQTVLNINSTAQIDPDSSKFKVYFSSSKDKLETGEIIANKSNVNIVSTNGTINNNEIYPTISNLSAQFTEPGQKIEYNFYVRNEGVYEAYLNSIVLDGNNFKSCVGGEGTSSTLVANACKGIILTVKVGPTTTTATTSNITDNSILPNSNHPVTITIEYNSGSARADGPFEVYFGDIFLTYSSAKTSNELPENLPNKPCSIINGSGTNIGDQIACGSEQFRVIDSDNNAGTITMITEKNITLTNTPVQSDYAGAISFADSIYWNSKGYVYNNNSKIYEYVEAYENYLKSIGTSDLKLTSATASLISAEQFLKLGCSLTEHGGDDSCPHSVSWIYSTQYWAGFDNNDNYRTVFYINNNNDAGLGNGPYDCSDRNGVYTCAIEYEFGIRPVVTIAQSQLEKAN